jgi:hypothetical protein
MPKIESLVSSKDEAVEKENHVLITSSSCFLWLSQNILETKYTQK